MSYPFPRISTASALKADKLLFVNESWVWKASNFKELYDPQVNPHFCLQGNKVTFANLYMILK